MSGPFVLRPPGRAGPPVKNFCVIFDFCITYIHRGASIISARPPAAAAAGCDKAAKSCSFCRHLGNNELHRSHEQRRELLPHIRDIRGPVRNKPNFRLARYPAIPRLHHSTIPASGDYAKQSQTWGEWGIWADRARGSQSRKTKPISATMPIRRSAFPGASRANKPNFGELAGRRARAGCTNKANWQNPVVRNKANLPGWAEALLGAIVRNKANFRHGWEPARAHAAGDRVAYCRQLCETKPIATRRTDA